MKGQMEETLTLGSDYTWHSIVCYHSNTGLHRSCIYKTTENLIADALEQLAVNVNIPFFFMKTTFYVGE